MWKFGSVATSSSRYEFFSIEMGRVWEREHLKFMETNQCHNKVNILYKMRYEIWAQLAFPRWKEYNCDLREYEHLNSSRRRLKFSLITSASGFVQMRDKGCINRRWFPQKLYENYKSLKLNFPDVCAGGSPRFSDKLKFNSINYFTCLSPDNRAGVGPAIQDTTETRTR